MNFKLRQKIYADNIDEPVNGEIREIHIYKKNLKI